MSKKISTSTIINRWIFPFVVIIWLIYLFVMPFFFKNNEDGGQFGDSFGALNTLFTGLAFAGVIISLIMQRKELELQRQELKLTRKELAASALSQKKLSESSNLQALIMAQTAKLNAQTALLNHYENTFNISHGEEKLTTFKKIENIIKSINAIKRTLDELGDYEIPY